MRFAAAATLAALLLPAFTTPAAAFQQFVDVREVATDTLHDVALTTVTPGRSTIYYNPILMQQVGPNLAAFVMTHEFGHVRYGHTGGALGTGKAQGSPDAARRQEQELEADCYAARILGETNPAAVRAAIQFFTTMGPFRFDSFHPAGAQRAAKLLSCLPEPEQPTSDAP
jgi:hypothetical protein